MDAKVIEVKATLEERVSKKGSTYTALVVKLTDTCEKVIFLESAEIELLKMKKENSMPSFRK